MTQHMRELDLIGAALGLAAASGAADALLPIPGTTQTFVCFGEPAPLIKLLQRELAGYAAPVASVPDYAKQWSLDMQAGFSKHWMHPVNDTDLQRSIFSARHEGYLAGWRDCGKVAFAAPTPPAAAPAPIQNAELAELKRLAEAAGGAAFVAEGFEQIEGRGQFYGGLIMHEDGETIIAQQVMPHWADYIAAANPAVILRLLAALAAPAAAPAQASSDELTVADYEGVLADHRRLVRELDALLNGDDAAKQASLCDIVAQVAKAQRDRVSILFARIEAAQQEQAKPTDFTTAQVIEFGATLIGHASTTDGMYAAEGKAWVQARLLEWMPAAQEAKPTDLHAADALLKRAKKYVAGAYECAFPDEQENRDLLEEIERHLSGATPAHGGE